MRNSGLIDLNTDEKIDIISGIDEERNESFETLKILSNDQNDEIRSMVAEKLVLFESKESELILLDLLKDKNNIVRINACDSLCIGKSLEVFVALKDRALNDKNSLVRSYAILSIADVVKNINYSETPKVVSFFKNLLTKEKVIGTKICLYKVLCELGEELYFEYLIKEIDNKFYKNRCSVVNLLEDLICDQNKNKIESILRKRLEIEETIAVKSSIYRVLNLIEKF